MSRSVSPKHAQATKHLKDRGSRAVKMHLSAKKVTAYVILDKQKNHVGTVQCVHNYDSGMMIVDVFENGVFIFQGKSQKSQYWEALKEALLPCSFNGFNFCIHYQITPTKLQIGAYTVIQAI